MEKFELGDGGQFVIFHVDEAGLRELHIALFSRSNQLAMLDKQGCVGDLAEEINAVAQLIKQFEMQDKRQNESRGTKGGDKL